MPATAITIGNFDGAHAGHVALVAAARREIGPGGRVIVLSFDPHPISVLRPGTDPGRLSRFDQRVEWLRAAGADEVRSVTPTPELLSLSPEDFIERVVRDDSPAVFVEGPDFRFGSGRSGSVDTLRRLADRHGYRVVVLEAVEAGLADQTIVRASSSMIRWLVRRGRVRDAATLLSRPYELRSTVVPGDRRGREIGVPTTNLDHGEQVLPADGIYVGEAVRPDGSVFTAAISVGTKPTFGSSPRVCEAHLIDYDGPLDDYGWEIVLRFEDWLREQIAYPDLAGLLDQLARDLERCRIHRSAAVGRRSDALSA